MKWHEDFFFVSLLGYLVIAFLISTYYAVLSLLPSNYGCAIKRIRRCVIQNRISTWLGTIRFYTESKYNCEVCKKLKCRHKGVNDSRDSHTSITIVTNDSIDRENSYALIRPLHSKSRKHAIISIHTQICWLPQTQQQLDPRNFCMFLAFFKIFDLLMKNRADKWQKNSFQAIFQKGSEKCVLKRPK